MNVGSSGPMVMPDLSTVLRQGFKPDMPITSTLLALMLSVSPKTIRNRACLLRDRLSKPRQYLQVSRTDGNLQRVFTPEDVEIIKADLGPRVVQHVFPPRAGGHRRRKAESQGHPVASPAPREGPLVEPGARSDHPAIPGTPETPEYRPSHLTGVERNASAWSRERLAQLAMVDEWAPRSSRLPSDPDAGMCPGGRPDQCGHCATLQAIEYRRLAQRAEPRVARGLAFVPGGLGGQWARSVRVGMR